MARISKKLAVFFLLIAAVDLLFCVVNAEPGWGRRRRRFLNLNRRRRVCTCSCPKPAPCTTPTPKPCPKPTPKECPKPTPKPCACDSRMPPQSHPWANKWHQSFSKQCHRTGKGYSIYIKSNVIYNQFPHPGKNVQSEFQVFFFGDFWSRLAQN